MYILASAIYLNKFFNTNLSLVFRPQVGDLICGETKNGGEWYRGYVSTTSPDLHIAAVDEARILSVHKALPYPKKFLNVCTFGVMCNMTTAELKVDIFECFICHVL